MKRPFLPLLITVVLSGVILFAGLNSEAQTSGTETAQTGTLPPPPPPPPAPEGITVTQQTLPPAPPPRKIVSSQPVLLPVAPQREEVPKVSETQGPIQQMPSQTAAGPPLAPPALQAPAVPPTTAPVTTAPVTTATPVSKKPPVKKPPTTPPTTPAAGEEDGSKLAAKKGPAISRPVMKEPHVMEGGIKSDLPPGWDEPIPLPPGGIRIEDLPQQTPPAQNEGK